MFSLECARMIGPFLPLMKHCYSVLDQFAPPQSGNILHLFNPNETHGLKFFQKYDKNDGCMKY